MNGVLSVNGYLIGAGSSTPGVTMTKLWENSNPTQSFAARNVTLSSDDYDMLVVIARMTTESIVQTSVVTTKGGSGILSASQTSSNIKCRIFDYTNDTTLAFRNGANSGSSSSDILIPYQIYGIKLNSSGG